MTLKEFCSRYLVRATAELTDRNPNMNDDDWSRSATHWRVRLYCGATRRSYAVWFSQGAAHRAAPTAEDVLSCLTADARSIDASQSFEDWASGLGYDTDSRTAERVYKACQKCAARLRQLFGDEGYAELTSAED